MDYRILHTITAIIRGGAENHLVSLVEEQLKKGCKITVVSLKSDGYWCHFLESLGIQVIGLGLRYYGDIKPILQLRSIINTFNPDIIHAHLPPAELYTRIALLGISSTSIPLVISKHNDEKFYQGLGERLVGRWVAQRSSRMIAISDTVKTNQCIKYLDYPSEKVATIYYGIDPIPYQNVSDEEIKKIRSLWSVTHETYLIGTVARLVPQKALHILLEGFSLYLKTSSKPAKLVIVGAGILESDLKTQAIDLGIQEQVIWTGFREDIPLVMNALDIFALTSVYEGLGLVLLEAMLAGKAVVASNISAIPEVVSDGITGILFPSQNSVALAEAFKSLENKEVCLRFGNAGREKVKTNFTLDKMVVQTLAVYHACSLTKN